jgi:uncharacterized protein with HEPN domain
MLEAIRRIRKYAQRGQDAFLADELIQAWMVHHLEILGEAARALSDGARQAAPEIPWREVIGMRNILVHDYFGIDYDEVWSSVERDVPGLESDLTRLLDRLQTMDDGSVR